MTQTTQDKVAVRGPTKFLINGEWVEPASGKYYDDVHPSTAAPLAKVAEGGAEDTTRPGQDAASGSAGAGASAHTDARGPRRLPAGRTVSPVGWAARAWPHRRVHGKQWTAKNHRSSRSPAAAAMCS